MAQYENLFTVVQATGPLHHGVPLGHGNSPRTGEKPALSYLLGKLGNAQIGPIYLGGLGLASLNVTRGRSASRFTCGISPPSRASRRIASPWLVPWSSTKSS